MYTKTGMLKCSVVPSRQGYCQFLGAPCCMYRRLRKLMLHSKLKHCGRPAAGGMGTKPPFRVLPFKQAVMSPACACVRIKMRHLGKF